MRRWARSGEKVPPLRVTRSMESDSHFDSSSAVHGAAGAISRPEARTGTPVALLPRPEGIPDLSDCSWLMVRRRSDRYKRTFDLTVWCAAHLLLFPLWLLLWILIPVAVLVDSGRPVFYRSARVGKDGRTFTLYKFRTMVPDAEATGPSWTVANDPRLTRFGRILRRTALDELPQVISILRGHMSFVGPRPYGIRTHAIHKARDPNFELRLKARPGLTGLAALYATPDDEDDHLRYDLRYIRCMSPWLDARLLVSSLARAVSLGWERKRSV